MQLTITTVVFRIFLFLLLAPCAVAFAQESPLSGQYRDRFYVLPWQHAPSGGDAGRRAGGLEPDVRESRLPPT